MRSEQEAPTYLNVDMKDIVRRRRQGDFQPHIFVKNFRIDTTSYVGRWYLQRQFCSAYLRRKRAGIILGFSSLEDAKARAHQQRRKLTCLKIRTNGSMWNDLLHHSRRAGYTYPLGLEGGVFFTPQRIAKESRIEEVYIPFENA